MGFLGQISRVYFRAHLNVAEGVEKRDFQPEFLNEKFRGINHGTPRAG